MASLLRNQVCLILGFGPVVEQADTDDLESSGYSLPVRVRVPPGPPTPPLIPIINNQEKGDGTNDVDQLLLEGWASCRPEYACREYRGLRLEQRPRTHRQAGCRRFVLQGLLDNVVYPWVSGDPLY